MSKKPTDKKGSARSAKTGQYVTKTYASKHPATTVVEKKTKPGGSPPITKGKK